MVAGRICNSSMRDIDIIKQSKFGDAQESDDFGEVADGVDFVDFILEIHSTCVF